MSEPFDVVEALLCLGTKEEDIHPLIVLEADAKYNRIVYRQLRHLDRFEWTKEERRKFYALIGLSQRKRRYIRRELMGLHKAVPGTNAADCDWLMLQGDIEMIDYLFFHN